MNPLAEWKQLYKELREVDWLTRATVLAVMLMATFFAILITTLFVEGLT